ncbi:MAG: orotate phosphoribosyltransferase [Burkholderiaceae bacterium]
MQQHDFLAFALEQRVLRFGDFQTKAGRQSPYFFNAGLFHSGAALDRLGGFYAQTLLAQSQRRGLHFDMLFGPAYKGIALAAATAMKLAQTGRDVPYAFNRKEAKTHGEGGVLIGAPLRGQVVIVDDVISAGTSVGASVELIRAAGAAPAAVLIALDRMEKSARDGITAERSAVQDVEDRYGIPVFAIADLQGLLTYLSSAQAGDFSEWRGKVETYRQRYGV